MQNKETYEEYMGTTKESTAQRKSREKKEADKAEVDGIVRRQIEDGQITI